MIKFEIKTNLRNLEQWLKDLAGKQLPFVTAKTLTDLAGEVNSAAIQDLKRVFTLRNKYVIRSFRRTMALKSQWPNCEAQAGSLAEFMALQVSGGMKDSKGDVKLGVPIGARPTLDQIVPKPLWVRNLLQHRRGYLNVKTVGGQELLLKQKRTGRRRVFKSVHPKKRPHRLHTGKRGWTRDTMYVLKKEVRIPARFEFERIAFETVGKMYAEVFRRNMERVMK